MAAVERGKRVLVKMGASLEVGDHDFMIQHGAKRNFG